MEVIGRQSELALAAKRLAEGSVVLVGPSGIGKTTLWRAAIAGVAWDVTVLEAAAAAAEEAFPYALLSDLIGAVPRDGLPEAQRRALERVLLLADDGPSVEPRLVGVALQSLLETLEPAVLAIDDLQWVDVASAGALRFGLRRARGVRLLATARPELEPWDELERIDVGPLSLGAIHHLLADRLDVRLPRPTLRRVHEVSGGNPLYALELARTARVGGEPTLPPSLTSAIAARLSRLSASTRRALAYQALAGHLPPDVDLTEAAAAGVLDHPLFGEVAASLLSDEGRRALHGAIADRSDGEQRAFHRALAAERPDREVAAALAVAAASATARGAYANAAGMWERAAQLTPDEEGEARVVRRAEGALALLLAGSPDEAAELLRELLDALPAGETRTRALVHLALFSARTDSRVVVARLEAALRETADGPARYEVVHLLAAFHQLVGDLEQAVAVSRAEVERAERDDPALLREALLLLAGHELALDRGVWPLIERAESLAPAASGVRWQPGAVRMQALYREGRFDEAWAGVERRRLERSVYDEGSMLWELLALELAAGSLAAAEAYAQEQLAVGEQIEAPYLICAGLSAIAEAQSLLGRVEEARTAGERSLELSERVHAGRASVEALVVLGLTELSVGDVAAAAARYARVPEPAWSWWLPLAGRRASLDAIEAFARMGDLPRAETVLGAMAESLPERAIGDGCLAAARGDLEAAIALAQRSSRSPARFGRGRDLLMLGRWLRQARRRSEARETLSEARALFEGMSAPLWVARVDDELRGVAGRAPAGHVLTESERRVAELAAGGLANKEIAARLVITVRTVEAHLTHAYAKLGISSRAALAARWPDV